MIKNIEIGKAYVFKQQLVQVTSVRDARVNFIGFKLLTNRLSEGRFQGADISDFTENAKRVLL